MNAILALLLSATGAAAFPTGVKASIGLGSFALAKYPALPEEIFAPAAMTAGRRLTGRCKECLTLIKSGAECESDDTDLGKFDTLQECADKVFEEGGRFFSYGTGSKAGKCYLESTSDATCSEGWESDSHNFYDLAGTTKYTLIKSDAECKSGDTDVGTFGTLEECADKVFEVGGRFFIYGKGGKAERCFHEKTKQTYDGINAICPEGWEADSYDFYDLATATTRDRGTAPTEYTLIKSGAECKSDDETEGEFDTLEGCADFVKRHYGGRFFSYGRDGKAGQCYWEKTSDATCSEGWESDSYDFYQLGAAITRATIIKTDVECNSGDTDLGTFDTLQECADKVLEAGGRFFIYGKCDGKCDGKWDGKAGRCLHEKTSDATCSEGWESDSYNFYQVASSRGACRFTEYVERTSCDFARGGEYCVEHDFCTACPSDSTCDGTTATVCAAGIVKDNVCEACPSGHTCDGTAATKCDAPKYVKDNVCTACLAGHTCDGTAATKCAKETDRVEANTCVSPKYATAAERAQCLAASSFVDACTSCCPECETNDPVLNNGRCHCVVKALSGNSASSRSWLFLGDVDNCVLIMNSWNAIGANGGDDAIVIRGDNNVVSSGDGTDAIIDSGENNEHLLVAAQDSVTDGKGNKKKTGSTPLIVGICVGAAVLVLAVAVAYKRRVGAKQQPQAGTPQLDVEVPSEA